MSLYCRYIKSMNRLSTAKRVQILFALCEGASVNATARQTGASKVTILKLLADAGTAVLNYQRRTLVNLPCTKIQADEIWSFVGCKERNVPRDEEGPRPGRCLDLDGNLRRYKAHPLLARRHSRCGRRLSLYGGPSVASREPRTTHYRRPLCVSLCCRRGFQVGRRGLRDAC
jgi:hypothetical protein